MLEILCVIEVGFLALRVSVYLIYAVIIFVLVEKSILGSRVFRV